MLRANSLGVVSNVSPQRLVEADKKEFTVELKTDEKNMNKKVEQELRGRLESKENMPAQFGVVLRIINRIIAARKQDDMQQYHFTNVEVCADGKENPGRQILLSSVTQPLIGCHSNQVYNVPGLRRGRGG